MLVFGFCIVCCEGFTFGILMVELIVRFGGFLECGGFLCKG